MDLKALQSVYFSKNRKLQDNNFNVLYVAGNTNKIRLRYAILPLLFLIVILLSM